MVVWEIHPNFIRLDCIGKWKSGDAKYIPLLIYYAVDIIEKASKYKGHPVTEDILSSKREPNSVSFSLLFESNENMKNFLRTLNPLY